MPTQLAGAIKAARDSALSPSPFASLRGRLVLVTAVLVATATLLAVALLNDAAQRQRASTSEQLGETARAMSLALDGEILQRQAVLRTLAASPALQTGDLETFDRQVHSTPMGVGSLVVLLNKDGRPLVDSMTGRLKALRFKRDWKVMARTGEWVSGLDISQIRHNRVFHLDRLVMVNGKPAYDLMMTVNLEPVQSLVARQGLPASWYAGVVDGDGHIMARNKDPARWVGTMAPVSYMQQVRASPTGVLDIVAKDGERTLSAYSRSPVTQWSIGVAIPAKDVAGDLIHSLQSLSIVGVVLMILGGGLTLWFVRGVARAVHELEAFAESLGRGTPQGAPVHTGLTETDFIGRALGSAAERLRARELELQRVNETLEARVEEATARLVQSQKIEAIGRLTGGVAHDFNNLLTAVIGNLELLRRKLDDERLLQFVANARSAADRGAKLTAQLLAFARKQTLQRESIDVNDLISGMGELLASTLDNSARLETQLDRGAPKAMADRTQLEMVLLNLVINARDALPAGGLVRISTASERIEQPPIRPEDPPPGDFVRITVADNGSGMTQDVLDKVFEPFFTTKPPGRGSGLGLPQALGVAQQLGGGLRIETFPGEGAQVHVYLPVAIESAPA